MYQIEPHPWIPYVARDFLATVVSPDWWAFEWGSGGSTIYWAQHCAHVVSIEHSREWYDTVQGALAAAGLRGQVQLVPGELPCLVAGPNVNHPAHYFDLHHPELNFKRYVEAIDEYPDEHFDLIFVDGMARPSCITYGVGKVKPGGWLLLDNSDVAALHDVLPLLADWERLDFLGQGRGFINPWQATFWRKPLEA